MAALWNTRGLNWPASFEPSRQKAGDLDILDWLRAMFGFQACCLHNKITNKDGTYLFYKLMFGMKSITNEFGLFFHYRETMSGIRESI